ncbi:MAG: hypothetical protein ACI9XB_003587 [Gammaproteobacteria bacterium]|jgi:hypothetical protein
MKNNFLFLAITFLLSSCNDNSQFTEKLSSLEQELAATKIELTKIKPTPAYLPGLIHNVFFWLKSDLTTEQKSAFLAGVKSLEKAATVKSCYIGPPASTEKREVVDNSFSYALLLHFDDEAGQNAYQVDPIHLKFVEDHKDKWERVIVYDNVVK